MYFDFLGLVPANMQLTHLQGYGWDSSGSLSERTSS
jgi:hypothetical protein